jgi:heme exporter protein A
LLEAINLSCMRQAPLFSHLHFQLQPSQLISIMGENGSGKSSLLRILTGCYSPESGEVYWNNQLIQSCLSTYRQAIHYLGHTNGIKLNLTVRENIQLMEYLLSQRKEAEKSILEEFSLDKHLHQLAGDLSAGQKRKLALIKLFLFQKKLWILDEPLTSLDINTQTIFLKKLNIHLQQGGMAIISTHQLLNYLESANMKIIKLIKSVK